MLRLRAAHTPSFLSRSSAAARFCLPQPLACSRTFGGSAVKHGALATSFLPGLPRRATAPLRSLLWQRSGFRLMHSNASSASVVVGKAGTVRAVRPPKMHQMILARSFSTGWPAHAGYGSSFRQVDVIMMLLVANGLVFAGWTLLPPRLMRENFVCTLRNVQEGRIWTLITPAFSHQDVFHLLFNSIGLLVMGRPVVSAIGPKRTLLLYLVAGHVSCLCHLLYVNVVKPRLVAKNKAELRFLEAMGREQGALGMSGSVMGVAILYATCFPHAVLLLYGVVPMRAPILVGLFIASDLYFSLTSPDSGTSHAGHLGGALCGALYALFLFSRRRRW